MGCTQGSGMGRVNVCRGVRVDWGGCGGVLFGVVCGFGVGVPS